MSKATRKEARVKRHRRLRQKVAGTAGRPRMAVCRTDQHIHVQFIDDEAGVTLVSVSSVDKEFKETGLRCDMKGAVVLGKMAAERAKAASLSSVVFDRGGFQFLGRIKALADAAREAGLQF
ncbi:MAG: 50S ribosomal protein L18 [Lentisphaeria bacterium]|nr:50S ribosomal protein L18 [Lentisphaeria bacterium]